jgi:hypothetical protein
MAIGVIACFTSLRQLNLKFGLKIAFQKIKSWIGEL